MRISFLAQSVMVAVVCTATSHTCRRKLQLISESKANRRICYPVVAPSPLRAGLCRRFRAALG